MITTRVITKQSLKRHLARDHGIDGLRGINVCLACRKVLGPRQAYHTCTVEAPGQTIMATEYENRCTICPLSFPTRRGLLNHVAAHDLASRVEERARAHPLPTHQPPPVHHSALSPERSGDLPNSEPHEDDSVKPRKTPLTTPIPFLNCS